MAGLEELGSAMRAAVERIEAAQSAVNVSRDRVGDALRYVGSVSDGSGNDMLSDALAALATADDTAETMLGCLVSARESVEAYIGGRAL